MSLVFGIRPRQGSGIPKSDQPPGNPLDMRPITVLSSVYRLWARVRAKQLGATWQERWAHTGMWGGRVGRGPQPLLLEVALDLELAGEHEHAGGLSFDLSKCFDRVPHGLLEEVLGRMRMPTCVKRPYLAMLRSATRRYKLGLNLDNPTHLHGGMLQGCPLSMVALNTVVNLWLSALKTAVPGANPRAYVDDVSVTAVQSSPEALVRDLTHAYEVSAHFVESSGMKLNKEKTFTFGSPHLENAICNTFAHLPEFRLVGGSFAVRHGHASATQLELQRLNKWSRTIQRSRHLPISWQDRCNALLRTRSQFTWGCGTHSMCNTKTHLDTLNGLRAGIMRCLLRRDQYVASPVAYFALVASPSLNSHFSRVVDGLVQFERALRLLTQRRDAVVAAFSANAPPCSDGPVTRLRQVNAMPEFAGLVTPLLSRQNLNVERWLHTVREQWRQKQFEQLARNRPNFQGVQQNLFT